MWNLSVTFIAHFFPDNFEGLHACPDFEARLATVRYASKGAAWGAAGGQSHSLASGLHLVYRPESCSSFRSVAALIGSQRRGRIRSG